jgi:hypothetical protein
MAMRAPTDVVELPRVLISLAGGVMATERISRAVLACQAPRPEAVMLPG